MPGAIIVANVKTAHAASFQHSFRGGGIRWALLLTLLYKTFSPS
jgi:hypothetical protein